MILILYIYTDNVSHCATLAACCQLVQFVGFALTKGCGRGRWVGIIVTTCQLSWLAVERPWLGLARPLLSFLAQAAMEIISENTDQKMYP